MYQFSKEASTRILSALGEIFSPDLTDEEIDQWASEEHFKALQSAEELHAFAVQFNWDAGVEQLSWVINNPMCELGTAILIYWRATPLYYYEKYESREQMATNKPTYYEDADWFGAYDLIKVIEKKFDENFFKTNSINYSIAKDVNDPNTLSEYSETLQNNQLKQPIHPLALTEMSEENFAYEIDWEAAK
jgi:hypothetical protein